MFLFNTVDVVSLIFEKNICPARTEYAHFNFQISWYLVKINSHCLLQDILRDHAGYN